MLAIDQRESMRAMFAEKQTEPVTDEQLIRFKLDALRALTPYASAVLIDRQFAWQPAIDQKAVSSNCGLIAAADQFIPSIDEIVSDVIIDEEVNPEKVKSDGAVALKLLVTWRPDESADVRIAMVDDFVARCKRAGLISIIEPVAKKRRDGKDWDMSEGIIAAARELGDRGADLYKAEVPRHGKGGEKLVRDESAELTKIIKGPWVVLSSGVAPDDFPEAVEWACKEGASGFLAGRAVWRNVIGSSNIGKALSEDAVPRLTRLCEVVDRVVSR
ncbi:sulfofructosephosphate aldolase [Rhizobium sp. BK226]|uniref:aldolase n=1 Tax=Rhizobium sp. BK226 TaxID=2587075 RepID=UPI00161F066F|nr:aldolase [Rhizobium sp. BK226]MBB4112782.1 sulfofructosephosphate aldolase [Rhizobium sp. BK226]